MVLTLKYRLFYIVWFSLVIWLFSSLRQFHNFIRIVETSDETYDFIIVGSGTAGSVLANRLSADGKFSVLLVEAGTVFGLLSRIPLLATFMQKTDVDWQFETTPQQFSSQGFVSHKQFMPRGKGLGGCSQLNYMLHFGGAKRDFQKWKENGSSWDFEDVKAYLETETLKTEGINGCSANLDVPAHQEESCSSTPGSYTRYDFEYIKRSRDYYLRETPLPFDFSKLSMAFVDATKILQSEDPHLESLLATYNTQHGVRHSTYHAYLKPVLHRENLKILLKTRGSKIIIEAQKATGILVSSDDNLSETRKIRVRREIILSAGALQSPQILMLSGIGPKDQLKRFNITLTHESPFVGHNLYDHLNVPLFVTVNDTVSLTKKKVLSFKEIFSYLTKGEGVFSNFGVIGVLNSASNNHGVGLFGAGSIDEPTLREISNYDQQTFRASFPRYFNESQEGFVLLNTCHQPESRGSIKISSNTIKSLPEINPNYLEKMEDITCTIRAIRLATKLIATSPFRRINATIMWPRLKQCQNFGPSLEDFNTNDPSDRYLECLIRTTGISAYHPGGTVSIGNSDDYPLDGHFKVRGVQNIRVVDASVLPTPVSGTPQGVLVAIAEHASKVILKGIL